MTMGNIGNPLRHLGMIATSPSWRRFFVGIEQRVRSIWWRRV